MGLALKDVDQRPLRDVLSRRSCGNCAGRADENDSRQNMHCELVTNVRTVDNLVVMSRVPQLMEYEQEEHFLRG